MPEDMINREAFHRYIRPSRIIADPVEGFVCRKCWSSDVGVRLDKDRALFIVCLGCGMAVSVTEENFDDGSE